MKLKLKQLCSYMYLHIIAVLLQVRTCKSDVSCNIVLQKIELCIKVMLHDIILNATF